MKPRINCGCSVRVMIPDERDMRPRAPAPRRREGVERARDRSDDGGRRGDDMNMKVS